MAFQHALLTFNSFQFFISHHTDEHRKCETRVYGYLLLSIRPQFAPNCRIGGFSDLLRCCLYTDFHLLQLPCVTWALGPITPPVWIGRLGQLGLFTSRCWSQLCHFWLLIVEFFNSSSQIRRPVCPLCCRIIGGLASRTMLLIRRSRYISRVVDVNSFHYGHMLSRSVMNSWGPHAYPLSATTHLLCVSTLSPTAGHRRLASPLV